MCLADTFGKAAIERQSRERRDQRRHTETGYDQPVDETAQRSCSNRKNGGDRQGQSHLPQFADKDGRQSEDRPDGQIDPAGDDDKGHRDGDQAEFRHQPRLVQEIGSSQKPLVLRRQHGNDAEQDDEEQRFVAEEKLVVHCAPLQPARPRLATSASTVARMRMPCTARSQ